MVEITAKAIKTDIGINIFSCILGSLIFSSFLLLYGWTDKKILEFNGLIFQVIKLIGTLFLLMGIVSLFWINRFIFSKRKKEFRTYIYCGATNSFVLSCEVIHILIIAIFSEVIGTLLFLLLNSLFQLQISLAIIWYLYFLYLLINLAMILPSHIQNRKGRKL